MIERYKIERVKLPTETLGSLYSPKGELLAKTMELPWRDNKGSEDSSKASCIPEGLYIVIKQPPKESRPYGYFRLKHVEGRTVDKVTGMSHILMHRITYVKDLLGCIGIGGAFSDLNKDGVPDMVESSKTLEKLYETLPEEFELLITLKPV
jgi:hypothetical protein